MKIKLIISLIFILFISFIFYKGFPLNLIDNKASVKDTIITKHEPSPVSPNKHITKSSKYKRDSNTTKIISPHHRRDTSVKTISKLSKNNKLVANFNTTDSPHFLSYPNDSKKEFEKRMLANIKDGLDLNLEQDLDKIKNRRTVRASYTINKNGQIVNVKFSTDNIKLNKNIQKAIHHLPKIKPCIIAGNKTSIRYMLNVYFDIESITEKVSYNAELDFIITIIEI